MPAVFSPNSSRSVALLILVTAAALPPRAAGMDLDLPPIHYSKATADNRVAQLEARIRAGEASLQYDAERGYLPALLRELDVPVSSQVFVFSKTSLQRHRIGPRTPRALYFNDDVYVGYCRHGDVLEVSAADPNLGTVFYTLDQEPAERPRFTRQNDACLICHGSSATQGFPGHLVRSVFPDGDGNPILSLGSTRVDHTTPFADRWGGWYVTGTSGKQQHRGNLILPARTKEPPADNAANVNVTDLKLRCSTNGYLSPHSDLVALMVLEHQAEVHNRITRAGFETRQALYQQAEFDRILGRKTDGLSESTNNRIQYACEPLVRHLLFSGEAPLSEKVAGTSGFADEFAARGPKDEHGRSLRTFDLQRRLFRYPCSYLIYSKAFDGLPAEAKAFVYRRLHEVLTGKDQSPPFRHLSDADRAAVRAILLATKPDLPADWKRP